VLHARRPGEQSTEHDCQLEAGVGADRFLCWVTFNPSRRVVTLFIQTVVDDDEYEAAIIAVRRGKREWPDP
jgi:hypothetical protein